jgi:hypothetical protein
METARSSVVMGNAGASEITGAEGAVLGDSPSPPSVPGGLIPSQPEESVANNASDAADNASRVGIAARK